MSGKGKSLLDNPILKFNEELKTIPKSPEFKQIVYDLDIKEFLKKQGDEKSPSLNDILDSLIKVLKNLFQTKEQNKKRYKTMCLLVYLHPQKWSTQKLKPKKHINTLLEVGEVIKTVGLNFRWCI